VPSNRRKCRDHRWQDKKDEGKRPIVALAKESPERSRGGDEALGLSPRSVFTMSGGGFPKNGAVRARTLKPPSIVSRKDRGGKDWKLGLFAD